MNGRNFISWTPNDGEVGSLAVDIYIGFKSMQGSGILLYVEDSTKDGGDVDGYLFLEIHKRTLFLHFKTKGIIMFFLGGNHSGGPSLAESGKVQFFEAEIGIQT